MKECSRCHQQLDESRFNPSKRGHGAAQCKACNAAAQAAKRAADPVAAAAYGKAYVAAHRERINAQRREYLTSHPEQWERQRKQTTGWRLQHPEQRAAEREAYRETGRKKFKEWCTANRATVAGYAEVRRQRIAAAGEINWVEWTNLKASAGNRCICCGEPEPPLKLGLDHITPLYMGGTNAIDNIQPLCWPCNMRKGKRAIDYRIGPYAHLRIPDVTITNGFLPRDAE